MHSPNGTLPRGLPLPAPEAEVLPPPEVDHAQRQRSRRDHQQEQRVEEDHKVARAWREGTKASATIRQKGSSRVRIV